MAERVRSSEDGKLVAVEAEANMSDEKPAEAAVMAEGNRPGATRAAAPGEVGEHTSYAQVEEVECTSDA